MEWVEEEDSVIALMNDNLQAIKYENVALQAQRDEYQAQLQGCQDTITHLKTRYVDHERNPGKDNIIIIVRKHTTSTYDKFHGLPYYIAWIQRRKRYVKFNRFEKEGHAKRKNNHFRLIALTREELYAMGVPAILDDQEE